MSTITIARCTYHSDRPAFARCMTCAKMLCQECATQWDGIWHCAACLGAKRGTRRERSGVGSFLGAAILSFLFLYLGARVMVWTSAFIAGLF